MAISAQAFARELKAFDGRRAVVKAMRRALTRAAKPKVREVKAYAMEILPARNGLGRWVARSTISFQIRYAGRQAGVRLRGRRKSERDRSDLESLDAGRNRHPSWGRRWPGQWHTQAVSAGWWSTPLQDDTTIAAAVESEVDRAFDEIRGG